MVNFYFCIGCPQIHIFSFSHLPDTTYSSYENFLTCALSEQVTTSGGDPLWIQLLSWRGSFWLINKEWNRFPSINPWLLEHEGRAQVSKLWLKETSSIDILTKAVCPQNKRKKNCELLHAIISLHLPLYSYVLAAMKHPNTHAPCEERKYLLLLFPSACQHVPPAAGYQHCAARPAQHPSGWEDTPQLLSTHRCQGAAAHTGWGFNPFRRDVIPAGRNWREKAAIKQQHLGIGVLVLTMLVWPHTVSTDYKQ